MGLLVCHFMAFLSWCLVGFLMRYLVGCFVKNFLSFGGWDFDWYFMMSGGWFVMTLGDWLDNIMNNLLSKLNNLTSILFNNNMAFDDPMKSLFDLQVVFDNLMFNGWVCNMCMMMSMDIMRMMTNMISNTPFVSTRKTRHESHSIDGDTEMITHQFDHLSTN